jgi:hypothetical protein
LSVGLRAAPYSLNCPPTRFGLSDIASNVSDPQDYAAEYPDPTLYCYNFTSCADSVRTIFVQRTHQLEFSNFYLLVSCATGTQRSKPAIETSFTEPIDCRSQRAYTISNDECMALFAIKILFANLSLRSVSHVLCPTTRRWALRVDANRPRVPVFSQLLRVSCQCIPMASLKPATLVQ